MRRKLPVKTRAMSKIAALFVPAQRVVTQNAQTGSMKKIVLPITELTVDTVMQRWPPTIRFFLDFGLHCVGCPIATFHSVEEACAEHGIDLATLRRRLRAAAQMAQVTSVE